MRVLQCWAFCLVLLLLGSASLPAHAQSCPSGYGACDNGGCCLNSAHCCTEIADGCCGASTPFCCGDGTCAASPSECGNASGMTCPGFDVPCGAGCVPAGSDCCDDQGHYCAPQSFCTSEIACLTGLDASDALLAEAMSVDAPPAEVARPISPLLDPPNGTARSCALSAPTPPPASGWELLAAGVALAVARRRRS
jgi:MYXO-CTERM domain-containing protein